jgi:hypothetical protein
MVRKVGGIESEIITTAGLVVVGIFGIKYVMSAFGSSPEDQQAIQNQQSTAANQNPFNPQFQPFLDWWKQTQPSDLSVSDGMASLQQAGDDGTLQPVLPGSLGTIYGLAETLRSALSVWNWRVDINAVFSVFSQLQTQVQCASLAAYVNYIFQKDLLTWLHYGGSAIPMIPNGLSDAQVAIIIKQVNALPITG